MTPSSRSIWKMGGEGGVWFSSQWGEEQTHWAPFVSGARWVAPHPTVRGSHPIWGRRPRPCVREPQAHMGSFSWPAQWPVRKIEAWVRSPPHRTWSLFLEGKTCARRGGQVTQIAI
jgi:hypothetical protein